MASQTPPGERPVQRPVRRRGDGVVVFFVACVVAGLVLAALGGWAWSHFGDPPTAQLTSAGQVYLGEEGLNQKVEVTLWFMAIGALLGLVAGLLTGWLGRRYGWLTVVGALLMCAIATVGSALLGQYVLGADPEAQAAHAQVGNTITFGLSLDTYLAYLGWPIGGMVGVIGAIFTWPTHQKSPFVPPSSTNVMADS
ncbi:MAG: hypothetical protein ACRDQA_06850 [Nocardioidaceae bacterium]